MTASEYRKDPRWLTAGSLFDAMSSGWKLGNGHARPNIRYAIQRAAIGKDKDHALLRATIWDYIKPPNQQIAFDACERVVRSAARELSG